MLLPTKRQVLAGIGSADQRRLDVGQIQGGFLDLARRSPPKLARNAILRDDAVFWGNRGGEAMRCVSERGRVGTGRWLLKKEQAERVFKMRASREMSAFVQAPLDHPLSRASEPLL